MARTNAIISISNRNKSYNGTQGNATGNNYKAWIQESVSAETISSVFGGGFENIERAKGLAILFEDVNLKNAYMTYNNTVYEVIKYAKHMDYRGNTSQVEFIYG